MSDNSYNAESIRSLEGLEAVQERPGMYIGSTDIRGLHHLVYEVVDNSIDEAMGGYCDTINITINSDGSVSVEDNGRGIPIEKKDGEEQTALEMIMTTLHAGGKFDEEAYAISGGLHGVGVSVVNALSEWLEVEVIKDGAKWTQRYEYGDKMTEITPVKEYESEENYTSGTEILFYPDGDTFETLEFEYETLRDRIQELAFLNPGVTITIGDNRPEEPVREEFTYEGGIKEYVEYLNEAREPIHEDVIYFEGEQDNRIVEVAMQFTTEVQDSIHGFANNISTREGGTHITGFKTSLTRIINTYAEEQGMFGEIDSLKGSDIREGLTAVVSVKHPDPQFEGQTKTKLGNSEMRGITSSVMHDKFEAYLQENPDISQHLIRRAIDAAKARKAADKAKEVARNDTPLGNTSLPGKLADCQSKDPEKSELFIVEGDSAGGSAKQARAQKNQAVLPLSGKILNVEKHRLDRILENEQIQDIVKAIGSGIGDEFDIEDVRYNTIVIFTDADVDGAHIRTLLLTFFYRHMKPLLEEGMVYAAKPPLYRLRYGGDVVDAMTDEERDRTIEERGKPDNIQRFKGLGEMNPDQLWDATMDPQERVLKQIRVNDAAKADKLFTTLMGSDVAPRRNFIKDKADQAEWVN